MNTVWIVMPILIVLMFLLGTELDKKAFGDVVKNPLAVFIGLVGQLVCLPLIAFGVAMLFELPPHYFIGLVLVGCCPGGSSSNVFSLLARGNVALSVTLTALSSVVTLLTIPFIMGFVSSYVSEQAGVSMELPVGKLLVQNLVVFLVPMLAGLLLKRFAPDVARKVNKGLGKVAFPALMLLALLFFLQYTEEIIANFAVLGVATVLLIVLALLCGSLLSRVCGFGKDVRRTIVIEVGMQNAAQAIAIAVSPFIFNSGEIAIPAIIYALLMNVILLTYVYAIRMRDRR